ncbi:hypothetical protein OAH99_00465 [Planktomarina sp.]|nr:hypothetical protein [Planktomarina sp.]
MPFANITKVFGIEDGLSRILIVLLVFIYLLGELQLGRIWYQLSIELYIILIGLLTSIIALLFDKIDVSLLFNNFFKFIVLVSVYTVVNRRFMSFENFIKYYYVVFAFSLFVSLPLWVLFPVPEFVFYDGSEQRFGGLHFELFNYCFSLCIALCSWRYNEKSNLIGLVIFMTLGLMSGSNMFPIFALVFLIPKKILNLFRFRFFACISISLICLMPVFIGFFLNELDFLVNFGLRSQSQFDAEGSSIFVRLFPYALAAEHMMTMGFHILLPSGLGSFEGSDLVMNTEHSYGGTGSPKAFIDLGIVLFVLMISCLAVKVSRGFQTWGSKKYIILRLNLICIFFISFGAGFFNLVAWSILFMTIAWTEDKNE